MGAHVNSRLDDLSRLVEYRDLSVTSEVFRETLLQRGIFVAVLSMVLIIVAILVLRRNKPRFSSSQEGGLRTDCWWEAMPYAAMMVAAGLLLYTSESLDEQEFCYLNRYPSVLFSWVMNLMFGHVPVYPTVVYGAHNVLGLGRDAVRHLSLLFCAGAMVPLGLILRWTMGRLASHLVLMLIATSPFLWFYAGQIEPYTLLLLLTCLYLMVLFLVDEARTRPRVLWLIIIAALGLYTHAIFIALVAGTLLVFLVRAKWLRPDPEAVTLTMFLGAILVLVSIPLLFLLLVLSVDEMFFPVQRVLVSYPEPTGTLLGTTLAENAQTFALLQRFETGFGWDSVVLAILGLAGAWRLLRSKAATGLDGIMATLLFVVALILTDIILLYFHAMTIEKGGGDYPLFRHLIFLVPFVALFMGNGLQVLIDRDLRFGATAAVILVVMVAGPRVASTLDVLRELQHPDYRQAWESIEAEVRDGDVLSFTPVFWTRDILCHQDTFGGSVPGPEFTDEALYDLGGDVQRRTSQLEWVVLEKEPLLRVGWGFFDDNVAFSVGLRSLFVQRLWVLHSQTTIAGFPLFSDDGHRRMVSALEEVGFGPVGDPARFPHVELQLYERLRQPRDELFGQNFDIVAGVNDLYFLKGGFPSVMLPVPRGLRQLRDGAQLRVPFSDKLEGVELEFQVRAADEAGTGQSGTISIRWAPGARFSGGDDDALLISGRKGDGFAEFTIGVQRPVFFERIRVRYPEQTGGSE